MDRKVPEGASLADKPSGHDLLGYQPYVTALAGILKNPELQTPFTVGVYGPWGTGKSTFMHLLSRDLETDDYLTVPFQPWQFDGKEEVWKALILTVVRKLEKQDALINKGVPVHSDQVRELVKGVAKLALNQAVKSWSGGVVDFNNIIDFWTKPENDVTQFLNSFRNKFQKLRDQILKDTPELKRRLFIFVDDLDRCTPESCIMVLEAIKLFFDMEGCVFVLGIDSAVVQKGIEFKYHKNLNIRGQDYLEKLIQLPFTLPPVKKETFENFVRTVTLKLNFNDLIVHLIIKASEGNPRQVKQLSNCLHLVQTVANELASENEDSDLRFDDGRLAMLLVLQVRFPFAFRWFSANSRPFKMMLNGRDDLEDELAKFIQPTFGELLSKDIASKFFDLMQFATTVPGFSDFGDGEEIQNYLEVTALVAKTSEIDPGITAQDILDRPLEIDLSQKSKVETTEDEETVDIGAPNIRIEQLSQQSAAIVVRWEKLRNKRMLSHWYSRLRNVEDEVIYLSRFMEKCEKTASDAAKSGDVESQTKAEGILDQIYTFSPGRVADDIRQSSTYLFLIGLFLPAMSVVPVVFDLIRIQDMPFRLSEELISIAITTTVVVLIPCFLRAMYLRGIARSISMIASKPQ